MTDSGRAARSASPRAIGHDNSESPLGDCGSLAWATPVAPTQDSAGSDLPRLAILWLFLLGPIVGLALAIVLATTVSIGPSTLEIWLAVGLFIVTGHGVTVGLHRYFTHVAFHASRPPEIALAVAGSLSLEGDITGWVATHRAHHAFADRPGDPHSPWRYGSGARNVARGLVWAQVGWLFSTESFSRTRWAPDVLADKDIQRIDRVYPVWIVITLFGPAAIGGFATASWRGALTAFLWAGLALTARSSRSSNSLGAAEESSASHRSSVRTSVIDAAAATS